FRIHFMTLQAENASPKKPETIDTLSALRGMLSLDAIRLAGRRPGDLYFGGSARSTEDTRDFLLWQHQADEFGVKLTDDNINLAIAQDTLNELTVKNAQDIDRFLRDRYRGGYTRETLYAALGDELRAQIAQVALTGSTAAGGTHTRTAVPVALTPDEYWDLFK